MPEKRQLFQPLSIFCSSCGGQEDVQEPVSHYPETQVKQQVVPYGFSSALVLTGLPPKSRQGEDAQLLFWVSSLVSKATVLQ